jgi:hypothetical protein
MEEREAQHQQDRDRYRRLEYPGLQRRGHFQLVVLVDGVSWTVSHRRPFLAIRRRLS